MDTEKINKTIESFKKLNININEATTEKLADIVMPIYNRWLFYQYFTFIVGCAMGVIVLGSIGYLIYIFN